jgi:hypothetical protein
MHVVYKNKRSMQHGTTRHFPKYIEDLTSFFVRTHIHDIQQGVHSSFVNSSTQKQQHQVI